MKAMREVTGEEELVAEWEDDGVVSFIGLWIDGCCVAMVLLDQDLSATARRKIRDEVLARLTARRAGDDGPRA